MLRVKVKYFNQTNHEKIRPHIKWERTNKINEKKLKVKKKKTIRRINHDKFRPHAVA